jgi:hypothetical protein
MREIRPIYVNHTGYEVISEAETMIAAFARAGCDQFDVTLKSLDGEKKHFRRNVSCTRLKSGLADLIKMAEHDLLSIIVRPHSKSVAFIQLDDISEAIASQLTPHSCCVLETSEGNYQAFVAVVRLDRTAKETVRNALIDTTSADRGASGAVRLAGTYNFKQQRRRNDGSYPRVRLISVGAGKILSVPELISAGLIKPQISVVPQSAVPKPKKPPRRRIFPSYEKAMLHVRRKEDGTMDRSAVDLLFAVTCLDWQITIEETIKLLHTHSPKAAERYDDYVERTVARAQAVLEKRMAGASRQRPRR